MPLREVCLDTETTGLRSDMDDRIVELALVELVDLRLTGRKWHSYFNPCRAMPDEAHAIHGLTQEFLSDKPLFAEKVDEILEFLDDDPLVAHNAPFDFGFLNMEMGLAGRPPLSNPVVDTLRLAKELLGATAKATLDALCRRYQVDTSARKFHGAMLDTHLLTSVYEHLRGGPNHSLVFRDEVAETPIAANVIRPDRGLGVPSPTEEAVHEAFVRSVVGHVTHPLWLLGLDER